MEVERGFCHAQSPGDAKGEKHQRLDGSQFEVLVWWSQPEDPCSLLLRSAFPFPSPLFFLGRIRSPMPVDSTVLWSVTDTCKNKAIKGDASRPFKSHRKLSLLTCNLEELREKGL